MSLLHPTPGELCDRLSIVELKRAAYKRAKRPTAQLYHEAVELRRRVDELPLVCLEPMSGLRRVNQALWRAEDRVRAAAPGDKDELAFLAKHIARLNDERVRLVREIDRACGCGQPVEEKVYATKEAR